MISQTIYAYTDIHRNTVMVADSDLNFTGTWSAAGTYWADPKDTVEYGNLFYVAIVDNENVVPTFVPKKGQRKWSELAVIRAGTQTNDHTVDDAYNLAQSAFTLAVQGTNAAEDANNLAYQALQTAWAGTAAAQVAATAADEALRIASNGTNGVAQALAIIAAGTNQEQIDHAQAMAAAQVALQTAWAGTAAAAAAQASADSAVHERNGFSFVIDGGGAVITSGFKGFVEVPFAMWIGQWTLVADQAGSLVVDITKSNQYAGFPTVSSITDADRPTLNNAQKNQNTNPSAWTRQLNQGDILGFVVVGAGTVQSATVALSGTRS